MSLINPLSRAQVEFTLGKEIGQEGNNSTAFIATDHQLDAQIVIKKISKKTLDAAKFFEEARILYLSAHPNVVQIHYACQDADHVYIAMPHYQRGSLAAQLDKRNLTVREMVTFGCNIVSGLHNIHSKGLVHFDIKPDNVLLSERGEGLVSDFGLAARVQRDGLAEQDRLYLRMRPPESFQPGDKYGREFDIYQLGLTLYRMAVGNAEFNRQFELFGATPAAFDRDAFKFAVRNGKFPDRDAFPAHVPARLRSAIRKCLETEPSSRYRAVIDVANDLSEIDDRLDWIYAPSPGERSWRRVAGDREYRLTVSVHGKSYAQKGPAGGKLSRVTAYCKEKITETEVKRFLKENG